MSPGLRLSHGSRYTQGEHHRSAVPAGGGGSPWVSRASMTRLRSVLSGLRPCRFALSGRPRCGLSAASLRVVGFRTRKPPLADSYSRLEPLRANPASAGRAAAVRGRSLFLRSLASCLAALNQFYLGLGRSLGLSRRGLAASLPLPCRADPAEPCRIY